MLKGQQEWHSWAASELCRNRGKVKTCGWCFNGSSVCVNGVGDVTHPCHLFLWDGTGQISWCQECYWQFPPVPWKLFLFKTGETYKTKLGKKSGFSCWTKSQFSVMSWDLLMFLGISKYWTACGEALTFVICNKSGFTDDTHVSWSLAWCKSHQPGTDLYCLWLRWICHAADRAARAACVSSGSSGLKEDWLLVHVLHGHLWLTDTWHSSWDIHLSPEILLHSHSYLQSRHCFPEEEGIRPGSFWGSIYCTLLGLAA